MKKCLFIVFLFFEVFLYSNEKLNYYNLRLSYFIALFDRDVQKTFYTQNHSLNFGSTAIHVLDENNLKITYAPTSEQPLPYVYLEYKIEDNVLYTFINREKSNKLELIPDELKQDKLTWTLEKDNTNLYSDEKLVSNTNFTLWNMKSRPPEGSIRFVDNTKIYIVNQKFIKLSYNAKVRKGPGTNYDYNIYNLDISNKGRTEINYFPKGRTVFLIGRTMEKQKIDDMEDYWYYCIIEYDTMWENGEDNGWIYGGLLDKEELENNANIVNKKQDYKTIPRDGLIGEWLFNGNAKDTSCKSKDGRVNGAKLFPDRFNKHNAAYRFDGDDDFIMIPFNDNININNQVFCISFWFFLYDQRPHHFFVKGDNSTSEYSIKITKNKLYVEKQAVKTYFKSKKNINTNQWHHVIVTFYKGVPVYAGELVNDIIVYIDGESEGLERVIKEDFIDCKNTDLTIGNYPYSRIDWGLYGLIDDIRIYNRDLSLEEAIALYNENNYIFK